MSARALFIDIDDTLCCRRPGAPQPAAYRGQTLLELMITEAVRTRGMARPEAEAVVESICTGLRWWHWTDFIVALGLEPALFWETAFEAERQHLGPVEPDLRGHLQALADAGWLLFITSNNPSSGICHKLRLAGIADIWGCPLIRQYLSPCDLHCMKGEVEFWRRCLAHTGLPAASVTVIGDNPHDDLAAPRAAGIAASILYAPHGVPAGLPAGHTAECAWAGIVHRLTGTSQAAA